MVAILSDPIRYKVKVQHNRSQLSQEHVVCYGKEGDGVCMQLREEERRSEGLLGRKKTKRKMNGVREEGEFIILFVTIATFTSKAF